MPRVGRVEESEQAESWSGKMVGKYSGIAEKVMDASEYFPRSLRLQFTGKDTGGNVKHASYGIPLTDDAGKRLQAFFGTKEIPVTPTEEDDLRAFIEKNIDRSESWLYVRKNFVQSRMCGPGLHLVKLSQLWKHTRDDGQTKMYFVVSTDTGLQAFWTTVWPGYGQEKGRGPDEDFFEINLNKWSNQYLATLGLDWKKFESELETCAALYDGHFDTDMAPIDPYFKKLDDPMPEILAAIDPKTVQIEVEDHPKYGPSPKRLNKYVQMAPVVVADTNEFSQELEKFNASWDIVTTMVTGVSGGTLTKSGKLTDEGRQAATLIMVPVIHKFPDVVKNKKKDGTPAVKLPPDPDSWELDGLVAISLLAERLIDASLAGDIDLSNPAGIVDRNKPKKIVKWAKKNVPELKEEVL